MKQKSIKNIRKEFKRNGIFYTPQALAEKLLSYVDIKPKTVYDPTCGSGSLLRVFHENVKKYVKVCAFCWKRPARDGIIPVMGAALSAAVWQSCAGRERVRHRIVGKNA